MAEIDPVTGAPVAGPPPRPGGGGGGQPGEAKTRTIKLPGGRLLDQILRWGINPATGKEEEQWDDLGSPYYPKEEPREGPTAGQQLADKLAREKFEYEKQQDELKREADDLTRKIIAAEKAADRAFDEKRYEDAKAERAKEREYRDQRDKVGDQQRKLDNDYRDRQSQIQQEQFAASQKQQREEFEGRETGYVGGQKTLSREELEERKRAQAAREANDPGNYFNIAWRSRGMTPPGQEQGQQLVAPQGQQPAQAPQAARPWWENYSLQRLERFPDEELVNLPPEILGKFRNEFLLSRPALMAMLSPERIRGEGQWAGKQTGFAQEVIDKHGIGAPTPPFPKKQPGMTMPGAPGDWIKTDEPTFTGPVALGGQDFPAQGNGQMDTTQGRGFQAPGPTEQDAIAELERIRARRQGVAA